MPRGIITDANVVGSVTSNSSIVQAAANQSTDLRQNKSAGGTVLGGANANGQIWSGATTPINYQVGGTPTATSGTGSTATITLTSASNLAVGDLIRVTGFTPAGYNTTDYVIVTAVSNTAPFTVSYASTATGAMTVAGQVQTIPQASFVARSAGTVPLLVRGNGFNHNLTSWFKSDGNTGLLINPYGSLVGYASANQFNSDNGANYVLRTVGTADQRANHYQVVNSASTTLAGFNGQGQIFTGSTTPIQGSATIAINTQTPTGTTNITITTASAHGILVGQTVVIAGITPAGYNGTWTAQSGTTGSTLVVNIGSNPGAITVAGTVTRNSQFGVTAASASIVPEVIRAAASQTANMTEWQNSSGTVLSRISSGGSFATDQLTYIGNGSTSMSNHRLMVATGASSVGGLAIRGASGQSVDLLQIQNSTPNTLLKVDQNGFLTVGGATVISNAVISSTPYGTTQVGIAVRGTAGQTANLQEWQTSTPSTVASISPTGTFTTTAGLNLSGANAPINLNGSLGTSGQVLTSAGAGATPTWTTVSGGSFTGGTLTSDLVLAAGSGTVEPLTFQTNSATPTVTSGAMDYDGVVFYATSNTNPGRALNTQNYYYVSSADYGPDYSTSGSVQSMLGATTRGITVAAGTTYEYEFYTTVQHTYVTNAGITGTYALTSSTVSGSPVVSTIHQLDYGSNTTSFTTATTLSAIRTTGNVTFSAAISSGSRYNILRAKGIIRVTGTGTAEIYPGLSLSGAAGDNVWNIQNGTVFKLTPIGNGTVTQVGTWA